MRKRSARLLLKILSSLIALGIVTVGLSRLVTVLSTLPRLYNAQNVPPRPVAIVFGAGLERDGTPSPVLKDRVKTAAGLYFAGKVEKLLLSGDNRFAYYNEPGSMRSYALSLGVPAEAIVLDYAGRRTYDTCYRARAIFGLQSAILVTQGYHLPRALYTCQALGMDVAGVPADQRSYYRGSYIYWNLRELAASITALWEVHVTRPLPVLGNPEPIFPIQ